MAETDILEMSDDEFLKLNGPIPVEQPQEEEQHDEPAGAADEPSVPGSDDEPAGSGEQPKASEAPDASILNAPDDQVDAAASGEGKDAAGVSEKPEDQVEATKAEEAKPDEKPTVAGEEKPAEGEPNYKEMYENLMKEITTPFKANGKKVQIESFEEMKRLAQHGLNYTKKMQQLAPNLKIMKSLEAAQLLDQDKINHVIDLHSQDENIRKAAIQKLLKDHNVDPMDVDTSEDSNYVPVNHAPSDKQMQFDAILDETLSNPVGVELVTEVEKEWDQTSRDYIIRDPKILEVLTKQREDGVYTQIAAEVKRQRDIGGIRHDLPFLEAYKVVGDHLTATGKLKGAGTAPAQKQESQQPAAKDDPKVIESRADKPKAPVVNDDKAKAAAPTRTVPPKRPNPNFNPLAMSDEEFAKISSNFRL